MSEEEQALQHLIERCDVKIATHIGVMIGIIFGSFTILGFLRGAGFPPKNLYVWYLIMIEISVVFPIYHSVCRALHYSAMVEILKGRSKILSVLERKVFEEAIETMPRPTGWLVYKLHIGELGRKIMYYIALGILIGWIVLLFAVLTLP